MAIKVLMFGWEFPPMMTGGLGMACYHLVKEMVKYDDIDITFVIPYFNEELISKKPDFVKLISPDEFQAERHSKVNVKVRKLNTILSEYMTKDEYDKVYNKLPPEQRKLFGNSFYAEVQRFFEESRAMIDESEFDIIHCHDWMTYLIGIYAKKTKHTPLIVHIHATAYQSSGNNYPDQVRRDIEKAGFDAADVILSNSVFTKKDVIDNYAIDGEKIIPVYLGVESDIPASKVFNDALKNEYPIVLYYGRVTIQKGPEYFVRAAKIVLEHEPNTLFIMAGDGDKLLEMINLATSLGMSKNFLFTGFINPNDRGSILRMADVFVFPSIAEPFGLIGLESMICKTPIIISKTSGISEVLKNALVVDFWDTEEMANLILSVLHYRPLKQHLAENGYLEAQKWGWEKPAREIVDVYRRIMAGQLQELCTVTVRH